MSGASLLFPIRARMAIMATHLPNILCVKLFAMDANSQAMFSLESYVVMCKAEDKKKRLVILIKPLFNPLNSELNPICHLLALLEAHHILHVSRTGFKRQVKSHLPSAGIIGSSPYSPR